MPANPEVEAYIRQKARELGIDENTAVAVSKAEALNVFDPSKPDRGGDEGSSFGPFQLHYAGMSKSMPNAGMGDEFTRATGLHASDPSTWKQQVDFALDTAKRDGWRQWMGAANTGIPRWAGINGNAGAQGGASSSPYTIAGPEGKTAQTQGPIQIRHPPNPAAPTATGTIGGYGLPPQAAPETAVASASPYSIDPKARRKEKGLEMMAGALSGLGGQGQNVMPAMTGPAPGAARVDQPNAPLIDPQQNQMQRQQLAAILARLNQGSLV